MSEYYCTHCGADLEDQYGFDPDSDHWTCTSCGQYLTNPDKDDSSNRFPGVGWFCDGCGACLNDQPGFSDWSDTWTCTECGYENKISDDEIYDSEESYQSHKAVKTLGGLFGSFIKGMAEGLSEKDSNDSDDDDSEGEDEDDEEDYDSEESEETNFYHYTNPYSGDEDDEQTEPPHIEHSYSKPKKSHWKAKLIVILISVLSCVIGYFYWEYTKLIEVGFTSNSCLNENYEDVVDKFEASGFTNIDEVALEDLDIDELGSEGVVSLVSIDENDNFDANDKYPYDKRAVIEYHSAKVVNAPITSKDGKGENYAEVTKQFEDAGFSNITYDIEYDIITGWLTDDGEVKSISINGDKDYSEYTDFRVDSEVVITYHTYAKNKK